jgi:hypothetical protein
MIQIPYVTSFRDGLVKISQFDNLGTGASFFLPHIFINKQNQLLRIENEETGEL